MGTATFGRFNRTFAINRIAQGINDTAQHGFTDRDIDLIGLVLCSARDEEQDTYNLTGSLDSFALLDETVGAEEHDADLTGFQVHAHALDTGRELDKLFGLDIAHPVDTSDTVTDREHAARLSKTSFFLDTTDSLF